MIVVTDNYGTILKIQANYLTEYDKNTYNLNNRETPVLVFKDYTNQYNVPEISTEVEAYKYTYTVDDGFMKIEPVEEPKTEAEIEQAYRDKLAQEVIVNVNS